MVEIKDLKDLQNRLNSMLVDFHDFCEEHGLRFFLEGGSLLGAVRHGGFIPWDDDIDISMMRDDYEKLLEITRNKKIMGKYRIFSEHMVDVSYPYPFAKMVNLETILHEYTIDDKFKSHLYIDIFPIDYIPSRLESQKELFSHNRKMKQSLYKSIVKINRGAVHNRIGKFFLFCPYRLKGYEFYRDAIVTKSIEVNKSEYVGVSVWGFGEKGIMKKVWYDTPEILVFNGIEYHVPKNYDVHLERLYGDYMSYPPKCEQVPKHKYRVWKEQKNEKI